MTNPFQKALRLQILMARFGWKLVWKLVCYLIIPGVQQYPKLQPVIAAWMPRGSI